jgi:DNA-binding beta-propeller fold protein YncE
MKNKLLNHLFIACVLTLCIITVATVKTADAKKLYLATDHETSEIGTYDINNDGTLTNFLPYTLNPMYGVTGMAVDANATTLFLSYEMSGSPNFAIVDATKMGLIRTVDDPQWGDFAGIDIDDVNNIVYATTRFPTVGLFAYDWDPVAKTLTPKEGNPVVLIPEGAYGLAVDEINGRLYIAIGLLGVSSYIGVYDLGTLEQIMTITPSIPVVGLAVDRVRGFVYTTAPDGECVVFNPGGNNTFLSKYDLATGVETKVNMGHGGMGIAVDETTGYVYVTGGCTKRNITVWDSNLNKIQEVTIPQICDPNCRDRQPAGIAIANIGLLTVSIDIKPGSYPNSINLGSGGTVAVAIFSTSTFDATKVDPLTVSLASAPVRLKGNGAPMASFEDVNQDGLLDIVVRVSTQTLELSETDEEAVLTGKTFDGISFSGMDTVRVVPIK